MQKIEWVPVYFLKINTIMSKTFCKKCMFDEEEIELNQNDEHNDGNNDHDHQDDDENKNMDSMDFMDRDCINIIKF